MTNIESAREVSRHLGTNTFKMEGCSVRHHLLINNGEYRLSIQAGIGMHSQPRGCDMPHLGSYTSVELMIMRGSNGEAVLPSDINHDLAAWNRLWIRIGFADEVATYVEYNDLVGMLDEMVTLGCTLRSCAPPEEVAVNEIPATTVGYALPALPGEAIRVDVVEVEKNPWDHIAESSLELQTIRFHMENMVKAAGSRIPGLSQELMEECLDRILLEGADTQICSMFMAKMMLDQGGYCEEARQNLYQIWYTLDSKTYGGYSN